MHKNLICLFKILGLSLSFLAFLYLSVYLLVIQLSPVHP
jgi:hypothetical protein